MKQNKIKGGVYSGHYWNDFYTNKDAKKMAHKQQRQRNKNAD